MKPPSRYLIALRASVASALLVLLFDHGISAQTQDNAGPLSAESAREVGVDPRAEDSQIATRLTGILDATGWFTAVEIRVDEGVVFLNGAADSEAHREWAARLAGNTQDVVAVVNRIGVTQASPWDLAPASEELRNIAAKTLQNLPLILLGLVTLLVTWIATKAASRAADTVFRRRLSSHLLRSVAARAVAVPVFLLGLYFVLKVSGLTGLAVTVIGGTGLLGLAVGFAFRDIAENFLASILISMQRPFSGGDLIEVAGFTGYVQSVNTRATLLMTREGNHVQIPNATIYKEAITNFTANPKARYDFVVGIGYDDSISRAQTVALSVLREHPAVLDDPESLVLVETLGAATVNLRILFWVDISKHSFQKVRSAVIRLVKRAYDQAGISMPDEAREVVFPSGVPVHMISKEVEAAPLSRPEEEDTAMASESEGGLDSEAEDIQEQARASRAPEGGSNLLDL